MSLSTYTIVKILMKKLDAVEEAFNDYLIRPKDESTKFSLLEKELGSLLNENQSESLEIVLQQLIPVIASTTNDSHSKLLFGLLESAITSNSAMSR